MAPVLLFLTILTLFPCSNSQRLALPCTQHPAYDPSFFPPLIRSYEHIPRESSFLRATYIVRHTAHNYHPPSDPTSTKYANLDLFFATQGQPADHVARLYFQRPAEVYLLVSASQNSYRFYPDTVASLPGWKSHGWAQLPHPRESELLQFGIHQHSTVPMPKYVQVFSKPAKSDILVPSKDWIRKNLNAPYSTDANTVVRVAEADGSAFDHVMKFAGKVVRPNERCPDALHRAWMVPDSNEEDRFTRSVRFHSWHPIWDPCFWCAYDHEHGSSAWHLMNYKPKYDYTAVKNNELEAQQGFKSFVFEHADYMVYYNIHAQTSDLRRVQEQFHTVAWAITEKTTGKLLLELQHKADFGFRAFRSADKRVDFEPITREDRAEFERQRAARRGFYMRSINILDRNRLKPSVFKYRTDPELGVYETWRTVPICANIGPFGGVLVDFRTPITGVKALNQLDVRVNLGRSGRRNDGASRRMRPNLEFAAEYCRFENTQQGVSGYFYTNPKGDKLLDGPGPNAVRQFISPGFRIELTESVQPVELGLGLHAPGVDGMFVDSAGAIDPDVN